MYLQWTVMRSSSIKPKQICRIVIAVEVSGRYFTPYHELNNCSQAASVLCSCLLALSEHPHLCGHRRSQSHQPSSSSFPWKKKFLISSFTMTRGTSLQHCSIDGEGKRATRFTFKNCPAPPCHPSTITTLSPEPPDLSKGLTLLPWQHRVLCRAGSSILYQHALSVSSSRLIRAEMFQ